jgi:hypothetical protein
VSVSAVLVVGCLVALGASDLASSRERLVSFDVRGTLQGVVLDLGDADVQVVRGVRAAQVTVERTERYAFGHGPIVTRRVSAAVLHLRSRCPEAVPSSCSASYRLVVPDNVPVDIRTTSGAVDLVDYHGSARVATTSGDVSLRAFCGFTLQIRSDSGSIGVSTPCEPQRLSLRSTRGDVHAVVPPGRYQVDAESASGRQRVRGITAAADAPFAIQALSTSGDVLVEGRA